MHFITGVRSGSSSKTISGQLRPCSRWVPRQLNKGEATKIRYKWNASLTTATATATAKPNEEMRGQRGVGQVLRLLAPRFCFFVLFEYTLT